MCVLVFGMQHMAPIAKKRWVSAVCVGASHRHAVLQIHQTGSFPGNTSFVKEH